MRKREAFTLIELLVVVLIIAILAAIALPKYMIARDRARLSGLMTIGKNVNDAMDRLSLSYESQDTSALDLLDISFKDYQGNDCTSGTCRITVSGKDYYLMPVLNHNGNVARNYTILYSYTDELFNRMNVITETGQALWGEYNYMLFCYQYDASFIDPDADRCERVSTSIGASCTGSSGSRTCYFN